MIQRYEIEDWLGPAFRELTVEQVDSVHAEAVALAERYPDPDSATEREQELSLFTQSLLGEYAEDRS